MNRRIVGLDPATPPATDAYREGWDRIFGQAVPEAAEQASEAWRSVTAGEPSAHHAPGRGQHPSRKR